MMYLFVADYKFFTQGHTSLSGVFFRIFILKGFIITHCMTLENNHHLFVNFSAHQFLHGKFVNDQEVPPLSAYPLVWSGNLMIFFKGLFKGTIIQSVNRHKYSTNSICT